VAVLSVKAAESKKKKIRLFASSGLKVRKIARKPEILFPPFQIWKDLEGKYGNSDLTDKALQ